MKIKVYNKKIPYMVIDDWYTDIELKAIWSEIDFYTNGRDLKDVLRADETIVARDDDTNKSLAESYRWYPNQYYNMNQGNLSPIFRFSSKLRCEELHNAFKDVYPWYNMFLSTNFSTPMVSYYEGGDYYKPHYDSFMYTQLIWLTKKPKLWTDGNLYVEPIEHKKEKILFKNNRSVIFPSMMRHSVDPIQWKEKPKESGYGRYTVTYFMYHEPTYQIPDDTK